MSATSDSTGGSTTSAPSLTGFTPFPPSGTFSGGPSGSPGQGGGGGDGGGGGNSLGSSTASNLYLYTFLATLVLLLLVSGAVVARSITLRVRARRAIEESIRNGTYVPPPPRDGATNVPKPVFFDARIDEKDEKSARWQDLEPVAASFVPGKASHSLPPPATSATPLRPNNSILTRLRSTNLNPFRTVQLQDILDELASRDLHSRIGTQQLAQPTQAELAAAVFGGAPPTEDVNANQEVVEQPSAVRVAVLIAMPDPAHPSRGAPHNTTRLEAPSSSSSSARSRTSSTSGTEVAKVDEDAGPPYVEFGVATVPFVPAPTLASPGPASMPSPQSGIN